MANRIVGNVYIIDSAQGNTAFSWPTNAMVQSVALWSTDTTGSLILAGATSTDHVVRLDNPNHFDCTVNLDLHGVRFESMKVPSLVAGTAFIYFQ